MAAAAPGFSVIGKPVPRIEGADKLTGRARYAADVILAGTLWACLVRSPHPHARIVRIDTSRALRVPGVRAVLKADDIPNRLVGAQIRDQPVLCSDRVLYAGDKVAVVAAEDPDAAEEGMLAVVVEYEELPAVFDPFEAMGPSAPVLHPQARSYAGFPKGVPEDIPNLNAYQVWERGDLAAGFAQAELVVEHTFRTPMMHQGYLEPQGCIVSIGDDGRAHVWASQKNPYGLRDRLAQALDRPVTDVVVYPITVGGDFGSKGSTLETPIAYHLAERAGRPVKLILTSHEDLTTGASPRHASIVTIRTGVRNDGRITAREVRVIYNSGAYAAFKPVPGGMLLGARRASGSYDIPAFRVEAMCTYTNQVPCGYMRAPGSPQALFAEEQHTDLVARELGIDPLEFRLRNVPRRSHGAIENVAGHLLSRAAEAIGWSKPKPEAARLVGRGISIWERGIGLGEGSSDVTVNPDGTITVLSAVPDNGTGALTTIVQIVAECFGVPVERVRLERVTTDELPIDVGSGASRMTNVAGHAAIAASEQVKEQLKPLAGAMLGSDQIEWVPGGWRETAGAASVSLEELAMEMIKPGDPAAHALVTITTPHSDDTAFCVQAAEVEVDAETGHVQLRHLVNAIEIGTIVNEIGHQGQIEGSIVQAMGYSLMEELAIDQGRVTVGSLAEYKEPTVCDVPPLTTITLPTAGPGPFGAMAIGEIPHMGTTGAIANAVLDAIGAPVFQLPLTAERVLATREAASQS